MQSNQQTENIVAVFAHPDDETFGPGGTLAKLVKTNNVYIICATSGEAGEGGSNLAQIRTEELKRSAKILGVKEVYFLGFTDGVLSNSLYHKLAEKIEEKLKILKPKTIITFEMRGVSGHIDHITVSMATTFVFNKSPFAKTLLYYCLSVDQRKKVGDDYFIYFPPGYKKAEIGKTFDISDVWDIKVAAMMEHKTQIKDAKRVLAMSKDLPKEEYFLVLEKD